MGKRISVITPLHKRTKRDYIGRMTDDKVYCMKIAKKYGRQYWDGDRRYGYGGYKYDGRWKPIAQKLIRFYHLKPNAKILDVGCGKAHLLYELKKLLPKATVVGFDISRYGITHAPREIQPNLHIRKAQEVYPFKNHYFDLVISVTTLHNLVISDVSRALGEIERVGKHKYIVVESYRNDKEQFNLECWALTAATLLRNKEWVWLYKQFGYTGNYEFIYFE